MNFMHDFQRRKRIREIGVSRRCGYTVQRHGARAAAPDVTIKCTQNGSGENGTQH